MQTTRVDGVPHVKQSDVVSRFGWTGKLVKAAFFAQLFFTGARVYRDPDSFGSFEQIANGAMCGILLGLWIIHHQAMNSFYEREIPPLPEERVELIESQT